MRNLIKLHALPYVAGEAVGLFGQPQRSRASRPHAGPRRQAGPGGKAGRQAPADGGDTPVAIDAAHRPGGEPETPADHRVAFPRVSSPRSTTRPGSAAFGVRRRFTAWRTP